MRHNSAIIQPASHPGLFRYYAAAAIQPAKKAFQVGVRAAIDDPTTLELYFLDEIYNKVQFDYWTGELTETNMVQEVIDRVQYAQPSRIKCIIDSVGGDIAIAMAIYNFLKSYPAKVESEILAMAASSATVIAMAANKGKLRMARNAFFIIHKAWGGGVGNADDLRKAADIIDRYTAQMVDIYAQRTALPAATINGYIADGDYWLTGPEAQAQGFVDELFNEVQPTIQVSARLLATPQKFTHVPAALLQTAPGQGQGAAAAGATGEEQQDTNETGAQQGGIWNYLKSELMNLKNIVSAALGNNPAGATGAATAGQQATTTTGQAAAGAAGGEGTAETGSEDDATTKAVKAAMEPVLTAFATGLQTELDTELGAVETRVMAKVKAEYGKKLQDLEKANEQLEQELAGKAGAESTTHGNSQEKRIVGKFSGAATQA